MLELIKKTRSFRRFSEQRTISEEDIAELINLARLGGSGRNGQPWQYMVINNPDLCKIVFPYLAWAGYLSDWKGPEEGERPASYILCLLNQNWHKGSIQDAYFDLGIATQNLLLGAMEKGIGACRIGAFSPKLSDIFEIPEKLTLSLVLALGYPKETVVLEQLYDEHDIKYWRDEAGVHHVPKRSLADIIVHLKLK